LPAGTDKIYEMQKMLAGHHKVFEGARPHPMLAPHHPHLVVAAAGLHATTLGFFEDADNNHDGVLTKEEFQMWHEKKYERPPTEMEWKRFHRGVCICGVGALPGALPLMCLLILMMDRFAADLDGNASITKKERDAFKKETGENLLQ
jgi:hypothetical protein